MSPDAPSSLRDVQRAMSRALVEGDTGLLDLTEGDMAAEGLSVYRSGFLIGVAVALAQSFPVVRRLVGEAFFDAAAHLYIASDPPRTGNLDDYGGGFPGFLAEFGPAASVPYLAHVARLEWAIAQALHAEDATPLSADDLAALAEADAEHLRLTLIPSVRMVEVAHSADLIWRRVLDEDDEGLAAIDPDQGPVRVLVDRVDGLPVVERLDDAAWRFGAGLSGGATLGDLLEAAGDAGPSLLAGYLVAGRLAGAEGGSPQSPTRKSAG